MGRQGNYRLMARYRKKPVVIEAVRWTADGFDGGPPAWMPEIAQGGGPEVPAGCISRFGDHLFIGTLEGTHTAQPGDWIIRGVKGELYPCKPDIFAATYERVVE